MERFNLRSFLLLLLAACFIASANIPGADHGQSIILVATRRPSLFGNNDVLFCFLVWPSYHLCYDLLDLDFCTVESL